MTEEIEKNESKNNLFPFKINKELDTLLPNDKRTSFQKSFSFLRKRLQIKQSRKTYIDSILKKCKARFFKAINDCLKQCLKIHIKKFPQSFITNISIEKNKSILGLTVQDIYQNFNLSNINLEECIKEDLCYKDKENYLKYICKSKISDLYFLYIESKRYMREIQYIKNQIGIKMYLLYIFVSENFVNYYLFSKPHFCKKNNKKIESKNEKNIINICGNNLNSVDYKKSEVISLFVDESENSIEKSEIDKNINYSTII